LIAREASLPSSGNLEQNARRARLAFFRTAIASGAVERVAVGHSRSDQAETVLFRLLRGAGTAGLAGARPMTADGIVRPLIDVERAEVEEYLTSRQIEWREDSTNASRRFARNRLRHELLPQLARDWNPAIAAALARTADQAAADEDYWRAEVDRISAECLSVENGAVLWKLPEQGGMPEAVARRLARRAIDQAKGDLLGVEFHHIEQIVRLAASPSGSGRVQAPGLDICRSFNQIRFGAPPLGSFRLEASAPGTFRIPGTNRAICLELIEKPETSGYSDYVYNDEMGMVDWGRITGSLCLRSWTPGDRYQPAGNPGIKKLKDLFQIARIPSWERVLWPVLADDRAIVWAGRFGTAAEYAAEPESRSVLRVRETAAT
jgi:tRNA(Ile)-lysidine synthase